jgi:hypothetical protein
MTLGHLPFPIENHSEVAGHDVLEQRNAWPFLYVVNYSCSDRIEKTPRPLKQLNQIP